MLRQLDEQIAEARATQSEVAIFLFDLDHFKSYNDNNGHVAGDESIAPDTAELVLEVDDDLQL